MSDSLILWERLSKDSQDLILEEAELYPSTWKPMLKTLHTELYFTGVMLSEATSIYSAIYRSLSFDLNKYYSLFKH